MGIITVPDIPGHTTCLPNLILANYHLVNWVDVTGKSGVGISNTEMMFIIHLISFSYEGASAPSLTGTLRRRMGYSTNDGIVKIEKGLARKRLLIVTPGNGTSSDYDLSPFAAAVAAAAGSDQSTKVDRSPELTAPLPVNGVNRAATATAANQSVKVDGLQVTGLQKHTALTEKQYATADYKNTTTTAVFYSETDQKDSEIIATYQSLLGSVSSELAEVILDTCESLTPPPGETIQEWVGYAVVETAEMGKQSIGWPYVRAILQRIQQDGSLNAHVRRSSHIRPPAGIPTPMQSAELYGRRSPAPQARTVCRPAAPPPPPSPAESLWQEVTGMLKGQMTKGTFDATLGYTKAGGIEGDTLVVTVINPYAADSLIHRMAPQIDRAILSASDGAVRTVRFMVPEPV